MSELEILRGIARNAAIIRNATKDHYSAYDSARRRFREKHHACPRGPLWKTYWKPIAEELNSKRKSAEKEMEELFAQLPKETLCETPKTN